MIEECGVALAIITILIMFTYVIWQIFIKPFIWTIKELNKYKKYLDNNKGED